MQVEADFVHAETEMGGGLADWKSYEALEETIRRDSVEVALELHLSQSTINKYKECPATAIDPEQPGRRNSLDLITGIIETIEKIDPERAYVPIKWLCARFAFLPPVKAPQGNETALELLQALLAWHKEIGEACNELSKALKDDRVTYQEYKRCYKELLEQYEAGMVLMAKMKAKVE